MSLKYMLSSQVQRVAPAYKFTLLVPSFLTCTILEGTPCSQGGLLLALLEYFEDCRPTKILVKEFTYAYMYQNIL